MRLKLVHSSFSALALVFLLSACTSVTDPAADEGVASANQVCSTEAPLGSSIAKRTCHSPMTQQQRDAVDREITLHAQPASLLKK